MKLHPLLTEGKNKHYNTDLKERTSLQFLEDQMTVGEMIGFCKGNSLKYLLREKGADAEDAAKAEKYHAYREELVKCPPEYWLIMKVTDYWKHSKIKWDYDH